MSKARSTWQPNCIYDEMTFLKIKLRTLLFIGGLVFTASLVYHSRDVFSSMMATVHWGWMAISVVAGLASSFTVAKLYSALLKKYNINITYVQACKIFMYSQITKYIPGKIWSIWYQATHLSSVNSTASVFFSNVDLTIVVVLIVAGISSGMIELGSSPAIAIFIWLAMLIIGTIFARKCHHFSLLVRFIGHYKFINKYICECHSLDKRTSIFLTLAAFSMLYAFSYIMMLRAAFDMSTNDAVIFTGYLGLSWVFGVVTIISPSGMGTRELFFILVARAFETDVTVETITAIAVFSRGWLITQDILGAVILRIYSICSEK